MARCSASWLVSPHFPSSVPSNARLMLAIAMSLDGLESWRVEVTQSIAHKTEDTSSIDGPALPGQASPSGTRYNRMPDTPSRLVERHVGGSGPCSRSSVSTSWPPYFG